MHANDVRPSVGGHSFVEMLVTVVGLLTIAAGLGMSFLTTMSSDRCYTDRADGLEELSMATHVIARRFGLACVVSNSTSQPLEPSWTAYYPRCGQFSGVSFGSWHNVTNYTVLCRDGSLFQIVLSSSHAATTPLVTRKSGLLSTAVELNVDTSRTDRVRLELRMLLSREAGGRTVSDEVALSRWIHLYNAQ